MYIDYRFIYFLFFFNIIDLIFIIVDLMHVRNVNEHLCSWMITWLNKLLLLLLLLESPYL